VIGLANEEYRRETKQSRISGDQILSSTDVFFGPNSAPSSGRNPPLETLAAVGTENLIQGDGRVAL